MCHGLIKWRFSRELYLVHFTIEYLLIPNWCILVVETTGIPCICTLFIWQSLITRSQFIYGNLRMKTPSIDKFSRRFMISMVCCIVNYIHLGVQKLHSDAAILFFSSHNKRFCFAMNNAASVALFGHIALDGTPQRPAPENIAESMEAFWWLQGEKGGHSNNAQSYMYHKYIPPDGTHWKCCICDLYEQYFDRVVISVNIIKLRRT